MTDFLVKTIDGQEVGIVRIRFVLDFQPKVALYVVDKELVPLLKMLGGNWHVWNKENPRSRPPFMRRRVRSTRSSKEFRLPHVCFTLKEAENPMVVAMDWPTMVEECQKNRGNIEACPIYGDAFDCRLKNWVLPAGILSEEQINSGKVSRAMTEHHVKNENGKTLPEGPPEWTEEFDEGAAFILKPADQQAFINRNRQARGLLPYDRNGELYDPNPFNVMKNKEEDETLKVLGSLKTTESNQTDNGDKTDSERKSS